VNSSGFQQLKGVATSVRLRLPAVCSVRHTAMR